MVNIDRQTLKTSLVMSIREFLDWTKWGKKIHHKYKQLGPGTEWKEEGKLNMGIYLSLSLSAPWVQMQCEQLP